MTEEYEEEYEEEYTLTFEEAIRAMLDGKYTVAEGAHDVFRFSTKKGFQYRTRDDEGKIIWKDTLTFIGLGLPQKKWMIVDVSFDPCPFCGSSRFLLSTHGEEGAMIARIICRECDSEVTLRGKDMFEICNKWNEGRK